MGAVSPTKQVYFKHDRRFKECQNSVRFTYDRSILQIRFNTCISVDIGNYLNVTMEDMPLLQKWTSHIRNSKRVI